MEENQFSDISFWFQRNWKSYAEHQIYGMAFWCEQGTTFEIYMRRNK